MLKQPISECLNINQGDVISIVGMGGKTSLMFYLARKLKGHTVVATSTKIYRPDNQWCCFINEPIVWTEEKEAVGAAAGISGNKLIGFSTYIAESMFDHLLIEADGSRGLPLKGWGPDEPVIMPSTTQTIGILDITSVGMEANDRSVFRLEAYEKLTEVTGTVTLDNLADVVGHRDGLFRRSRGKRILFINKADDERGIVHGLDLVEKIQRKKLAYGLDQVIVGSVWKDYGLMNLL